MKEVTQLLRRKGQGLVNELENEIMFARHHLPSDATDEQRLKVDVKVQALKSTIKKIKTVFELPVDP